MRFSRAQGPRGVYSGPHFLAEAAPGGGHPHPTPFGPRHQHREKVPGEGREGASGVGAQSVTARPAAGPWPGLSPGLAPPGRTANTAHKARSTLRRPRPHFTAGRPRLQGPRPTAHTLLGSTCRAGLCPQQCPEKQRPLSLTPSRSSGARGHAGRPGCSTGAWGEVRVSPWRQGQRLIHRQLRSPRPPRPVARLQATAPVLGGRGPGGSVCGPRPACPRDEEHG